MFASFFIIRFWVSGLKTFATAAKSWCGSQNSNVLVPEPISHINFARWDKHKQEASFPCIQIWNVLV